MPEAENPRLNHPDPFRFNVEDYYLLEDAGALGEAPDTELIDGEIIEVPPAGPEHSGHLSSATDLLYHRLLGLPYCIRCQLALRLGEETELEPDIAVLKPRVDKYTKSHPGPVEALLVIEIAKASLSYDLHRKAPAYSEAGVPEYWVLDLDARVLHVMREPSRDIYGVHLILRPGEAVACAAVPELVLPVAHLFV